MRGEERRGKERENEISSIPRPLKTSWTTSDNGLSRKKLILVSNRKTWNDFPADIPMRKFCALFYARQKLEEANGVTELFFKFIFNYSYNYSIGILFISCRYVCSIVAEWRDLCSVLLIFLTSLLRGFYKCSLKGFMNCKLS